MRETSLSGFHTPKTDNQNLIYKVGWLFEKNIEPLFILLHPTTDIVLWDMRGKDENIQINEGSGSETQSTPEIPWTQDRRPSIFQMVEDPDIQ